LLIPNENAPAHTPRQAITHHTSFNWALGRASEASEVTKAQVFCDQIDGLVPACHVSVRQAERGDGIRRASAITKHTRADLTGESDSGMPLQRIETITFHDLPHISTRLSPDLEK